MHTRRHFGLRLAALSATLAARALPAIAAEQTLRFGSISVAGSPTYTQVLEPFARAIEQTSKGRVEVVLKPAGGYGSTAELLSMVEKGGLDMVASVSGYYPGRFPRTSVIELPLIFNSAHVGTQALGALLKEGLIAQDYARLQPVALYVVPPFGLFTTGKQIASLRDLRGLRVRTPGQTVGLALARLGAIPLGVPMDAVGSAIASGTVDAVAASMDTMLGTKGVGGKFLYEQMRVVVDLRFAAPAQFVAMNPAKWAALPPDLQAAITQCAAAFVTDGVRNREDAEAAARARLQAMPGYSFIAPSPQLRDALQQAMAPTYDDWQADMAKQGIDGKQLLSRTRALVQQFSVAAR